MSEPLVSIVIPTFNRAQYLPRTLASAKCQTYPNIEIVVCDNQSQDGSDAIIKQFIQDNPRLAIRYIQHSQNIGPVRNWFSGIREARGDYIKILFSDDILYPNCVKDLLVPLHHTNYAFSYGMVDSRWKNSSVTNYARLMPGKVVTTKAYLSNFFSPYLQPENYPISPGAALLRRNVLLQVPIDAYEDALGCNVVASGIGPDLLMFLYSFHLCGGSAVYVNKKISAFQGHENSITIKSGIEKLDRNNFSALLQFYDLSPIDSHTRLILEDKFDELAGNPSIFKLASSRLSLLRESGVYTPRPKKLFYPFLGVAAFHYWRLRRSLEYRLGELSKGRT